MRKKIIILYVLILIAILSSIIFLIIKSKDERNHNNEIRSEVITEIETTEESTEETTVQSTEETTTDESEETITETENSYIPEFTKNNQQINHSALLAMNSDYKCWLNIPGTTISYPVVMTNSNDYYLHRTFDTQEYAYAGTLFIDAYSKYILNQDNLIIYGHNMKDGSMFGTIKNFKDASYFNQHPYIEIYTEDEIRVYEIFSIRQASSDIDTLNFALDGFTAKEYINSAKNESIQFRETKTDGQIITLSTCVGDYDYRLLLSGIRIQ